MWSDGLLRWSAIGASYQRLLFTPTLQCSITPCRIGIVGQLHDVIEIVLTPPDLENMHQSWMRAGDRFEILDAGELALEWAAVVEGTSVDYFHGAVNAEDVAREPDLAIAALADATDKRVIGDEDGWGIARGRAGRRRGRGRGA